MYPPNPGENVCHQTETEPGSSGRIPIRRSHRSPCGGGRPPRTSSLPSTNFQLEAGLEGGLAPVCVWRLSPRHQPGQAMAAHGACHRLYLCWACLLPHRQLLRARAVRREALEKRKLKVRIFLHACAKTHAPPLTGCVTLDKSFDHPVAAPHGAAARLTWLPLTVSWHKVSPTSAGHDDFLWDQVSTGRPEQCHNPCARPSHEPRAPAVLTCGRSPTLHPPTGICCSSWAFQFSSDHPLNLWAD